MDRLTSLSFIDFLEYIARIADAISPPSRTELVALGCAKGSMRDYIQKSNAGTIPTLPRRQSRGVAGTATRFLHEKLETVIWTMLETLCEKYQVCDCSILGWKDANWCSVQSNGTVFVNRGTESGRKGPDVIVVHAPIGSH